jgi:hypothetical protein
MLRSTEGRTEHGAASPEGLPSTRPRLRGDLPGGQIPGATSPVDRPNYMQRFLPEI